MVLFFLRKRKIVVGTLTSSTPMYHMWYTGVTSSIPMYHMWYTAAVHLWTVQMSIIICDTVKKINSAFQKLYIRHTREGGAYMCVYAGTVDG